MADTEEDIDYPPKKSKKKLIIIGGALVVLLAGGAGGVYMFYPELLGMEEEESEEVAEADVLPTFYSLDPFSVNLKGGTRVLRFEVQVQVRDVVPEDLDLQKARLRDSVILLASDYTYRDLEGTSGKVRLRDELLARLNSAAMGVDIDDVLFTQFVVQ